eukprot:m.29945 g.29945  ORF g.29945 m.29945 type:complete len:434 (-) comp9206_c0_seq1:77-1378(-)
MAEAKKGADTPRSSVSPAGSHYNVIPGKSLGLFVLGMPVGVAIKRLADNYLQYKAVNFVFNDKSSLSLDLVLDLVTEGVQLRFDSLTQRLKFIDVYDPKRITLNLRGELLCAAGSTPAMNDLYHKIGPTDFQLDEDNKSYVLKYPGLSLWFHIPQEKWKSDTELSESYEFSDGTAPLLSNLCLYFGKDSDDPQLPPLRDPIAGAWLPHYFEEVLVSNEGELEFTVQKKKVRLGDNCQDVLLELGPPDEVFFKSEDKMSIHAQASLSLPCADYLYNYFNLGVDILFDCQKHSAKKFVLHTNQPAHFDFNRYTRCNFRLQSRSSVPSFAPQSHERPMPRQRVHSLVVDTQPGPVTLDEQLMSVDLNEPATIGPDAKWDEVAQLLQSYSRGIKLSRPQLPNTVDPFGQTTLHHHGGMIFEVLRNNYIATVTFFQPS